MKTNATPEDRITAWLVSDAPPQAPDRLLEDTFEQTRRIRRRGSPLDWRLNSMMRTIAVLTTAAVVVGALLVVGGGLLDQAPSIGAPPASSAPSPEPTRPSPSASVATLPSDPATVTGQIAYHASVGGNQDIYRANGDGTGVIQLTTEPGADVYPSWSPDGDAIAFVRDGDIYVMAADGTGVTRVTSTPEAEKVPSFSPDGTSLVFGRPSGLENFAIHAIDTDGSNERLLYEEPDTHLEGDAVLIAEDVLLAVRDEIGGGGLEIVRVDLTTGVETPLTNHRDGEESFFAVSPDRTRVAYQSDGPEPGLLVMDIDGTNSRLVTSEYRNGRIAWTADGSTISFVSGGWINLIRPDGTGLTRLLKGDAPSWRPTT
jgi:dipeptidyl aminopeptidase/acylaminoacyl peptidase